MSTTSFDKSEAPSGLQRAMDALRERLPVRLSNPGARGLICEHGVIVKTPSRLALGTGVAIQRRAILHCGGRAWSNYKGFIELGDNVVIGPNCILYGAGTIRIGEFSHLGPAAMIMTQSGIADSETRQSTEPGHEVGPVVLGKGVWIGAGAVILGNTVLGDNCNVGPNSVVQGEHPPGTTLIGNPARPVMRRKGENGSR